MGVVAPTARIKSATSAGRMPNARAISLGVRPLRRNSATEQQPCLGEPVEPRPQLGDRALCRRFDQLIAKLAADDRADLTDLPRNRP